MPSEARGRLSSLVQALADPTKAGRLHHSIADQSIGRVALAWHPALGDDIATLTAVGAECRLGLRSAGSLRLMAEQVLALGSVGEEGIQRIALGTPAALVWLAVLDQLRYARLASLIDHCAPVEVFGGADVSARFEQSRQEDFRWPLNFVARLAPLPLHELDVARDPSLALSELEVARLVERVSGDQATPTFELSPGGAAAADAILHDVSKLALGVTQTLERGAVTDIVLLVRSALALHLFYLSGGESAFGGATGVDADNLLGHMLTTPEPRPVAAPVTSPQAVAPGVVGRAPEDRNVASPHGEVTDTLIPRPRFARSEGTARSAASLAHDDDDPNTAPIPVIKSGPTPSVPKAPFDPDSTARRPAPPPIAEPVAPKVRGPATVAPTSKVPALVSPAPRTAAPAPPTTKVPAVPPPSSGTAVRPPGPVAGDIDKTFVPASPKERGPATAAPTSKVPAVPPPASRTAGPAAPRGSTPASAEEFEETFVPGRSGASAPNAMPETEAVVQLRPLLLAEERVGAPPRMVTLEEDATIGRAAENRIAWTTREPHGGTRPSVALWTGPGRSRTSTRATAHSSMSCA